VGGTGGVQQARGHGPSCWRWLGQSAELNGGNGVISDANCLPLLLQSCSLTVMPGNPRLSVSVIVLLLLLLGAGVVG
jgi:hypothetical protein